MSFVPMDREKRELVDLGRPTNHRRYSNIRSVKVMYPRCVDNEETGFKGCQDSPGAQFTLWHKDCLAKGHDPYYRLEKREDVRPLMVEVCATCEKPKNKHSKDCEFVASGRLLRTGEKRYFWYEELPNLKQVQITSRVSGLVYGFDQLTWARAHGAIFPKDHPIGSLKDFCEYHNCWSQKVTVKVSQGKYCNEEGAKRVILDLRGKAIEAHNQEKIAEQMDSVRLAEVG